MAGGLSRLVGKAAVEYTICTRRPQLARTASSSLSPEGLFQLQKDVNRIHERDGDGVRGCMLVYNKIRKSKGKEK